MFRQDLKKYLWKSLVSANFYSLGTRVSPLFLHIFTRGFGSSSKFGKPAFLEKNWWFKHDFQGIFLHKPYQQPKNTWWSSTSTMKNRIHSMENLQQQKSIVSPWLGTEESSFCCVQTWLVFERSMVPSSETGAGGPMPTSYLAPITMVEQ